MASHAKRFQLEISSSEESNMRRLEPLDAAEVHLGLPEGDKAGPTFIDLGLETISRDQAMLERIDDGFVLTNVGRRRIGLYEYLLEHSEKRTLHHQDTIRIPGDEVPYVRITLLEVNGTRFLPLQIDPNRREVLIFGKHVHLQPLQTKLVLFLYGHLGIVRSADEIIAHVWADDPPELRRTRKGDLERLVAEVRKKIRTITDDETFLETVPHVGLRMVF